MIRRDTLSTDGSPAWILIPQIAHAHLAGDLADVWHFDRFDDPTQTDLRYAARHHDDGWAAWDEHPGVDPTDGRPINFDEMRLADSLSIWERSIEISTIQAPLAGYLVAGHFGRLLDRFDSWRTNNSTRPLATQFLAKQAAHSETLLAAWKSADSGRSHQVAERGVSLVQLFDAISLWLCCAERYEPWEAKLPNGKSWTFSPAPASRHSIQRIAIDPWPFDRPSLTLTATGRSIAQANYHTTDELLAAASEPALLRWELAANTSNC